MCHSLIRSYDAIKYRVGEKVTPRKIYILTYITLIHQGVILRLHLFYFCFMIKQKSMNIDMFQEIILRVYNRNDFRSLYCTCKTVNAVLNDKYFLRDKLKGSLYDNMIPYNIPVSGGYVIRRMKKFKDFIKYHCANFHTPGDKGYDEISVFCVAYNSSGRWAYCLDIV